MKTSQKGLEFLHREEGLRLKAYLDSAGIPTIGYGNTYYENGSKVKMGDSITKERADSLFELVLKQFENAVNKAVKVQLTQNQFDALVSFTYNVGIAALNRSTLLKKINANPCDPTITSSFEAWKNAGGKPILLKRRQREAALYFDKGK